MARKAAGSLLGKQIPLSSFDCFPFWMAAQHSVRVVVQMTTLPGTGTKFSLPTIAEAAAFLFDMGVARDTNAR